MARRSSGAVPGTGRIMVGGINEKAVRVYLDPIKLSANNLDVREVEKRLMNEKSKNMNTNEN